jgi:hypothetical protein
MDWFPVAYRWADDLRETIFGFAVVTDDELVLEVRWTQPVRYSSTAYALVFAVPSRVPAQVFMNGVHIGAAPLMGVVAWIIGVAKLPRGSLDYSTSLLATFPKKLDKASSRNLRQRLVRQLGGIRLQKLLVDAKQKGLLLEGWEDWDWPTAVTSLEQRETLRGESWDDFAVLLAASRRLPSKKLANRLRKTGDSIVCAYIRIALSIEPDAERDLFDQALARFLRHAYLRWLEEDQIPSPALVTATGEFLLKLADRTAFIQEMRRDHGALSIDDLHHLEFGRAPTPLNRCEMCAAESDLFSVELLWGWLVRCADDFFASVHISSGIEVRELEHAYDELLELISWDTFTCHELRTLPWNDLFGGTPADAQADEVELPDLYWTCPTPPNVQLVLLGSQVEIQPITSSAQLKIESEEMLNCLASSTFYVDRMVRGESFVFSIKGQVRASLQLSQGPNGFFVEAIKGRSNQELAGELETSPTRAWRAVRGFIEAFCRFNQQSAKKS